MIPRLEQLANLEAGIPRESGDDPDLEYVVEASEQVFPARAGMIPRIA